MMVLPLGMAMPNEVAGTDEPLPKSTAAAAADFSRARGAREDRRGLGAAVARSGRFRKGPHPRAGIEARFDSRQPPRIAHRQPQHGYGFAVTLRDAAHGIFRAGAVLHAEGADGAPGSDARDCVRHVQSDALLPHHHRADIGAGGVFDEMIDRVTAENCYSLTLHDFRNGGAEFHAASSRNWPMSGSAYDGSWNRNPSIGKVRAPLPWGSSAI